MLNSKISLSSLQSVLDSKYGNRDWVKWEPETVLFDIPEEARTPLLKEKILVLQILNEAFNRILALPEFLLWTNSVMNNEPAEFEHVMVPNSLELAWTLYNLKKIGKQIGKPFEASEELAQTIGYILREEGYSEPVAPFEFVPKKFLVPGQTTSDTMNKSIAISKFIDHMEEESKQ